jgi:hypothetical protein
MVMVLNLGVCSRFLTNDFMDTNVLVCGSNVTGVVDVSKSFVYTISLAGVSMVGQTDLWWLVGWCLVKQSAPSSVCLVSNSSKIGPVLCGNLASGSAYPWLWILLVIFCWWVVCVPLRCRFALVCMVVGGWILQTFGVLRQLFLHWWKGHPFLPLPRMTWLLKLFARYWGWRHCWRVCHPFRPWTCVLLRNCKILVQINMMCCCGLLRPCCLHGRLVLRPSALPCSPRIVYIAPLFSLLGLPVGRQVSLVLGAVLRQPLVQGTETLHTS